MKYTQSTSNEYLVSVFRSTIRIKYTSDFKDLVSKSYTISLRKFYVDEMLKWYFGHAGFNKMYC